MDTEISDSICFYHIKALRFKLLKFVVDFLMLTRYDESCID